MIYMKMYFLNSYQQPNLAPWHENKGKTGCGSSSLNKSGNKCNMALQSDMKGAFCFVIIDKPNLDQAFRISAV